MRNGFAVRVTIISNRDGQIDIHLHRGILPSHYGTEVAAWGFEVICPSGYMISGEAAAEDTGGGGGG